MAIVWVCITSQGGEHLYQNCLLLPLSVGCQPSSLYILLTYGFLNPWDIYPRGVPMIV